MRAPPDGYTLLLVACDERDQRDALRQAQLRFHPRHRAGRRHHPRPRWSWWSSVGSGQDGSRVHRLCQGQSGQDQHGVGRHRHLVHLAGELFKMMAGVDMLHVPYRGLGAGAHRSDRRPGAGDVRRPPSSIEHIRAGKLRALAVTTATRLEALPDVPTVGRVRAGLRGERLVRRSARPATRRPRSSTSSTGDQRGLADPKIKARLADLGGTVLPGSPADFGKLIAEETEKWGKVR